ncbi:MAG: translocation/assembly module TamB domain-containing protein [Mangrovibacterium sp.]
MKKLINIAIRIVLWLFAGLLVLLLALLMLLQTPAAKNQLLRLAEKQANGFLNATLTIGKLEGNFWSGLRLKQVVLTNKADTLASIASVSLRYNLKALLTREVRLDTIQIDEPRLNLVQLSDSTWNLEHLLKATEPDSTASTETTPFAWTIRLQSVTLSNGKISIQSPDSLIPRQIDSLYVQLTALYSKKQQLLRLHSLSLQTRQPNLQLKQLRFSLNREGTLTTLSGFELLTGQNKLTGKAQYAETAAGQTSVELATAPLQTDEFRFALPELSINIQPEISWKASLHNDSLNTELALGYKQQTIALQLQSANFYKWLTQPGGELLSYRARVNFANVRPNEWSGQKELKGLLNGWVKLAGAGTNPKTLQADLEIKLHQSKVADYQIGQFSGKVAYRAGSLNADARLSAAFGRLTASAALNNLFASPVYRLTVKADQLNLAPLMGNDSLQSNINLQAGLTGQGFDPQTLSAAFKLNGQPSVLMGIAVDTAFATGSFARQTFRLDSLYAATSSLRVRASGNYELKGHSSIGLVAELLSLDAFSAFLPDADVQSHGRVEAHLSGPADSLAITADGKLLETRYNDYHLETVGLQAKGYLKANGLVLKSKLRAEQFTSNALNLDSLVVESQLLTDSLHLKAGVFGNELNSTLATTVFWKNLIRLRLEDWRINVRNQKWKLAQAAVFEVDSAAYRLSNFDLRAAHGQRVRAGGLFSTSGNEDFSLTIEKLKLNELLQTFGVPPGLNGLFNGELTLKGTAAQPLIDGAFKVDSTQIAGYALSKAEGQLSYGDSALSFSSELKPELEGRFLASVQIPLTLNFESFANALLPDGPLTATVTLNELPLNLLSSFIQAKELSGMLNGELKVSGSPNAPDPSGFFTLSDGLLLMPELGIDYRKMQFRSSFSRQLVSLDTLSISSADGSVSGSGKINFNSAFYKGEVQHSDVTLRFRKFNPVNLKQLNMQVNGDASLSGNQQALVFGGKLVIPQSVIDLGTAMRLFGQVYTPDLPPSILMQELERQQQQLLTSAAEAGDVTPADSTQANALLDKLTGKIKVNIPKNTWIKSQNLRIELSGDLEVLKSSSFFEIFGTVTVVRGQYELFGRTFVVSEGEIAFEGGEDINPTINLRATYTIKSQSNNSQTLAIAVSGEALSPKLAFTLDNEAITEGDALSYIVFGKGLNELSSSEQSNVAGTSAESMAKSAAASLLASQLTKLLGNKLNVDYIEVKSRDDFDNASLEVGKYLTNDLFISYEQQFGSTTDSDLSRYEVRLEYEILKFLFLQLNNSTNDSGFDLIFKLRAN